MVNDRVRLNELRADMLEKFEKMQHDPANLNNAFSMIACQANIIDLLISIITEGESSDE